MPFLFQVEEKSSESDDLKLLKVVPKQVSRRKPRSVKSGEQYIPLKVETVDFQAVSATSSLLRESIEENKCQTRPTELATLNLFDNVKVEMEHVKLESRPLQKMGSSTQGRLKTALSEVCPFSKWAALSCFSPSYLFSTLYHQQGHAFYSGFCTIWIRKHGCVR